MNSPPQHIFFKPLQTICLSLFLFLPCYYAATKFWVDPGHESVGLQDVEAAIHPGKASIGGRNQIDESKHTTGITRPKAVHLSTSSGVGYAVLPRAIDNDALHTQLRTGRARLKWRAFVGRLRHGWAVIAASAFTFLASSPAMLQIPGSKVDPILCAVLYLAVLRAAMALVSASLLILIFGEKKMKSGKFATAWFQYIDAQNGSLLTPWALPALPVVSLCWAAILFVFSVFFSIWRGGLTPAPSIAEPQALGVVLRIIITVPSTIDLVCTFKLWLYRVMKRLRSALSTI